MPKKGRKQERIHDQPRPAEPEQLVERSRLLDDESVRRKSRGHKKSTADKWNQ